MRKQLSVGSRWFSKGFRCWFFPCLGVVPESTPPIHYSSRHSSRPSDLNLVCLPGAVEVVSSFNSTLPAEAVPDVSRLSRSISAQFRDGVVELKINDQPYRLSEALWGRFELLNLMFQGDEANTGFELDQRSKPYYQTLQELLNRTVQNTPGKELIDVSDFAGMLKEHVAVNLNSPFVLASLYKCLNYFDYKYSGLFKKLYLYHSVYFSIYEDKFLLCVGNSLNQKSSFLKKYLFSEEYLYFLNFKKNVGHFLNECEENFGIKFENMSFKKIFKILTFMQFFSKQVVYLDLSCKTLSTSDSDKLFYLLSYWTGLTKLNLQGNQIGGLDPSLLGSLSGLTALVDLNLSGTERDLAEGFESISSLGGLTKLQILNLSQNKLRESGFKKLSSILYGLSELTALDLSRNDISYQGNLENNLFVHFSKLTKLQDLNLSHNQFTDYNCIQLASAFRHLSNLANLNLSFNRSISFSFILSRLIYRSPDLSVTGLSLLKRSFACLTMLQILNFNANTFRDFGVDMLADSLSGYLRLRILTLSSNKIGGCGARQLVSKLRVLPGLQVLDLSCNNIKDEGAKDLSEVLGFLTGLKSLGLSSNGIGYGGVSFLVGPFNSLKNLESLTLCKNELNSADCEFLKSQLDSKIRIFF